MGKKGGSGETFMLQPLQRCCREGTDHSLPLPATPAHKAPSSSMTLSDIWKLTVAQNVFHWQYSNCFSFQLCISVCKIYVYRSISTSLPSGFLFVVYISQTFHKVPKTKKRELKSFGEFCPTQIAFIRSILPGKLCVSHLSMQVHN